MLRRFFGLALAIVLAVPACGAGPVTATAWDDPDDPQQGEHLEEMYDVLERWTEVVDPVPVREDRASPPRRGAIDGQVYRVTGFDLAYVHDFTWQPPRAVIRDVEVELAFADGAFTGVAPGVDGRVVRLGDVDEDNPIWVHESALPMIAGAIARELDARPPAFEGAYFVAVDDGQIHPATGRDLRRRPHRLTFRAEYTGTLRLISRFLPRYVQAIDLEQYPDGDPRPAISRMMREVRVNLVQTPDGYVAWRPAGMPGTARISPTLEEISEWRAERYSDAAIQQVVLAIRDYLTAAPPRGAGLMGVVVRVPLARDDVEPGEVDVPIVTGVVESIRTMAAGDRLPGIVGPARVNHPAHRRIRDRSPVQPGDVLQRDVIDEHVHLYRRHPGRRVDVALSPGDEPYGVNLDYLVTEGNPLLLYAQVSNTGTRETGRWRFRFGLLHNQLTGNDDILSLDYNTAEFSRTHAFSGSYEARVLNFDRLRWRVYGTWSEFDAADIGFADLRFTGEMWQVGAEMIANIYQDGPLFIDAVGGARFQHAAVENFFFNFVFQEGSEDFIIPHLGLRLERATDVANTRGALTIEGTMGMWTDIQRDDLGRLGRPFPDKDWVAMRWELGHSFFLEPALNRRGWADPATWQTSTLAHELSFGFRGLYAFDNRLIPHHTMTAGGMYSVRGYPESAVSGDTVLIGTAEYRFHLPRIFQPAATPGEVLGQPFRWRPQHVYGRPDWDLIFKGFVDAARTMQSDRRPFEDDHTLLGAGLGVEFHFRRNVSLRLDWGHALLDVDGVTSAGTNRIHFAATFMY